MEIQVIHYSGKDKDAVITGLVELQKHEYALSDTRKPSTIEGAQVYLSNVLEKVAKQDGAFLCAQIAGKIAGFIVCWINREEHIYETEDFTTHGYISDAFVFEKYRRRGVLKHLQVAVEQHFAQFPKVKRICLYVLANNAEAMHAYEAIGFSECEILMQKRIKL